MTILFNDPTEFKDEMLAGFVAAYSRIVRRVPDASGVMTQQGLTPGKVIVVIGGGSGHYPAFCGYVGPGLADVAVMGNVFASPSAEQVYRCAKAAADLTGGDAGVLFSYGNYSGDVLNFDMAQERLRLEGLDVRTVTVTDDVASAPGGEEAERRGVAGDFFVFKVAGASAARGDSLDEVERLTRKANARTRSFGVAFGGCTLPGQNGPLFTVAPGQMELGLGVHGEPGLSSGPMGTATEIAGLLVEKLLADAPKEGEKRVGVLLNGLGTTKYEELFVLYKDIHRLLEEADLTLHRPIVDEAVTSLDMGGCSLSLIWLDDELAELLDAPCESVAYASGQIAVDETTATADLAATQNAETADSSPVEEGDIDVEAAQIVRRSFHQGLAVMRENEAKLGDLDAVAGDGDHGITMVRGMTAAVEAVDEAVDAAPAQAHAGVLLVRGGMAFADAAGGASGALFGLFMSTVGHEIGPGPYTTARVSDAIQRGIDRVGEMGKTRPGDKTFIDTLVPFAQTLAQTQTQDAGLTQAWKAAIPAAEAGAEATAEMAARRGRSANHGERTIGHCDPGAVSMLLLLQSVGHSLSASQE